MEKQTKKCPFCAEQVNIEAIKYKHCGEILYSEIRSVRAAQNQPLYPRQQQWNLAVAAILNFFIPNVAKSIKVT